MNGIAMGLCTRASCHPESDRKGIGLKPWYFEVLVIVVRLPAERIHYASIELRRTDIEHVTFTLKGYDYVGAQPDMSAFYNTRYCIGVCVLLHGR